MSASTIRAEVRLGENALAQLRQAEARMRAECRTRTEAATTELSTEFAALDVAEPEAFGHFAARCDALGGILSDEEIARERAAIFDDARGGARDSAAQRVEELEQRAAIEHATAFSQQLVTDEILGRAGATFVGTAREGDRVKGRLEREGEQPMPLTVISAPPSEPGGPTRHQLVFDNQHSGVAECEQGEERVREIARAAGAEMALEEPGPPRTPGRKKRKRQQAAQAQKTRRAG